MSQQKNGSILSFFKPAGGSTPARPQASTPKSTNKPTQTPKSISTPTNKSSGLFNSSSPAPRNGPKTPLTARASTLTSEADLMTLDEEPSSPETNFVPQKRVVKPDPDSDDEMVIDAGRPKKRLSTIGPKIVDSDSSQDIKPVTRPSGSKSKKVISDSDDFSASASEADQESDNYFDDDLDDFLVDDEPQPKKSVKPKPKPKPASSTPSARPTGLSRPSGSGSLIKTQAELAREKQQSKKEANESAFSFLVNPKDADGKRPGEEAYDPRTLYIPKSAWAQFTPFEQQFWEIKQYHFDVVLFFQKGKFFELYEEDAAIGHREFDLKLTDRVKMKMVGVPESSFDFWASKFLAQGYKVGRVEQSETALGAEMRVKDGKKAGKPAPKPPGGREIVRRELKSVLTSGTIVDGTMLEDDLANHCVSIKEFTPTSGNNPTFGVCVVDAATAEFQLSTFEDDISRTQLETLIRQHKPKELIHEKGNLTVATLRVLRSSVSLECQWTALKPGTEFLRPEDTKRELVKLFTPAKKADDENGDLDMHGDEATGPSIPEAITKMYDQDQAMSALGGMIWYLRQLNLDQDLVTARNFNIYDPLSQGKALILDGQTLAHIEVLQNSQGGIEGTLLELLSKAVTPFGKRLFKIWLCAPLRDPVGINDRLDAVEDIMSNADFTGAFARMVKGLPDLERLISRIHAKACTKEQFVKVMKSFKTISKGLGDLADVSSSFKANGIKNLLRGVPDLAVPLKNVRDSYDGDELLPKEEKNPKYERVNQIVIDIETKLDAELEAAKSRDKAACFKDIGTKDIYQIQLKAKTKVPSNWVKMSSTQQFDRYYSPEVEKLVKQLKEARERKQTVVTEFQFDVYGEFDADYAVWMAAIRTVAELDCLISLAKASSSLGEPAVRPEIVESDHAFVEFEELRHPCALNFTGGETHDFIPNDVGLGGSKENMVLLTGPNMAGKSTLLRMTCAAVIMAQLGCYVPATKARIAPIDAIYSRMGANDFIFANASTFKVEMDDCNKILQKSTPRSLVILDELGRGTSTYDGMSIAFSVLHRLATHIGCIGFFATHFTSLTEDYANHPEIRLCNMLTQLDDHSHAVVFLYKLVNGSAPRSYGPHVASMAGLPEVVVRRAIDISRQFEATSKAREQAMRASESLSLTSQADAAFLARLAGMSLDEARKEGKDPRQLARTLKTIRKAFLADKEAKEKKVTGGGTVDESGVAAEVLVSA